VRSREEPPPTREAVALLFGTSNNIDGCIEPA
jgi:hypothetical protein